MLYLECYSGISGDMTVAALLDLGADREKLLDGLSSLGLSGYEVKIGRRVKCGVEAAMSTVTGMGVIMCMGMVTSMGMTMCMDMKTVMGVEASVCTSMEPVMYMNTGTAIIMAMGIVMSTGIWRTSPGLSAVPA